MGSGASKEPEPHDPGVPPRRSRDADLRAGPHSSQYDQTHQHRHRAQPPAGSPSEASPHRAPPPQSLGPRKRSADGGDDQAIGDGGLIGADLTEREIALDGFDGPATDGAPTSGGDRGSVSSRSDSVKSAHMFEAKFDDDAVLPRRRSRVPSLPSIEEGGMRAVPTGDEAFRRAETVSARKRSIRQGPNESAIAKAASGQVQQGERGQGAMLGSDLVPGAQTNPSRQGSARRSQAQGPGGNYYEMEEQVTRSDGLDWHSRNTLTPSEQEYRPQKFDKEKFRKANKEKRAEEEATSGAHAAAHLPEFAHPGVAVSRDPLQQGDMQPTAAKPKFLDDMDEDLMNEIVGSA
ncbi:hypothetical protein HK105_203898 [Polyrhizophydium stewartii]|uniref:Uncharacterized protein n=1 Tax=Polyrhizophydium stewartii TaxID=2732419 RepID=A0ABR4NA98_9FUNG